MGNDKDTNKDKYKDKDRRKIFKKKVVMYTGIVVLCWIIFISSRQIACEIIFARHKDIDKGKDKNKEKMLKIPNKCYIF